ncbi:Na/Pi cotransporter [Synergistales bacterium]|nr:Na/Pi cotransporter [Synergistales bacterium]
MNIFNIMQATGGVGLFLYGIKLMSESLQFIAGDRMRQLIGTLTSTPLRGLFVGIIVTMLIQSSSGTTVMTISFVNAGIMTLNQAIGVIMGANIGTTVTAQIIAFKADDFALGFVAIGVVFFLFGRSKKQRYIGNGLFGLGLLFLGMRTMNSAMAFLSTNQAIFASLSQYPILGVLAGTVVTMIVQSSAATIGLTMIMATQGLLTLDAALPIIMGDNIGTTITGVLATIGTNRSAKQTAAAHVLFNVIGAVIFMICLPFYADLVRLTADTISHQIANSHSIFNVGNAILFLPFTKYFARFIRRVIPDDEKELIQGPLYLDKKLITASPAAAVEAVKDEFMHMGDITLNMARIVRRCYTEKTTEKLTAEFAEAESAVNAINRAISTYASEVWQRGLSEEVSTVLGSYVTASGDVERVGDHFENLTELSEVCDGTDYFSKDGEIELWDMYDTVEKALTYALDSIRYEDVKKADEVIQVLEKKIDEQEKQYRRNHIDRLNRGECNPEKGVIFIDILSNLERIGDHSHNIACFTRDIVSLSKFSLK